MKKLHLYSIIITIMLNILTNATAQKCNNIYDFTVKNIEGQDISLQQYKGKVLLIVNVASKCGLTPQYEQLEELYNKYKNNDFVILAFPCNQFLGQEPGNNQEIQKFCSNTYNVTFDLFDKIDVNGENAIPLYKFLKYQAPFMGYPKGYEEFASQLDKIHKQTGSGFDKGNEIRWNFCKFLVSKDGKTIKRYEPMISPTDLEKEIIDLLK